MIRTTQNCTRSQDSPVVPSPTSQGRYGRDTNRHAPKTQDFERESSKYKPGTVMPGAGRGRTHAQPRRAFRSIQRASTSTADLQRGCV